MALGQLRLLSEMRRLQQIMRQRYSLARLVLPLVHGYSSLRMPPGYAYNMLARPAPCLASTCLFDD